MPTTMRERDCPGGRLVVYPPKASDFVAEDNVIVGNVALYGATGGEGLFPRNRSRTVLRQEFRCLGSH